MGRGVIQFQNSKKSKFSKKFKIKNFFLKNFNLKKKKNNKIKIKMKIEIFF